MTPKQDVIKKPMKGFNPLWVEMNLLEAAIGILGYVKSSNLDPLHKEILLARLSILERLIDSFWGEFVDATGDSGKIPVPKKDFRERLESFRVNYFQEVEAFGKNRVRQRIKEVSETNLDTFL